MRRTIKLPENRPEQFKGISKKDGDIRIVFFGDSLTHGAASDNFIKRIRDEFNQPHMTMVNAGINGDLAFNLVQRLPSIVELEPDFVFILVGTNDVRGSEDPRAGREYVRTKKLPCAPSFESFSKHYIALIEQLMEQTGARIIMSTLPPMSEHRKDPIHAFMAPFNEVITKLATSKKLPLVDLYSELLDASKNIYLENPPRYSANHCLWLILKTAFKHHALKLGTDTISDQHGMYMLTDFLHLNERAGKRVAEHFADQLRPHLGNTSDQH